ncbi:MAG: translation elongation factor 4 [Candidatus Omnitrophica bacterium]|nr:translation elongation factor 4 [Candidatus Omnitrophota bacterium]MBU0895013.1 translation elongation factor 4 [Candidatus Omnitrophota bacterium]MBU1809353.1 translation elongation factor 4 [Candidatus Omnitrophota bacterium]
MDKSLIRNFSIIAHIDHGKSTLADRILQFTGAISEREFRDQLLDDMDLEKERGITIKASAVRISYKAKDGFTYELNLIDTPGHVDFTYEVSKSVGACEGALLVVDASQGVEAQTVANLYLAMEHNLVIIPVINKIDLPSAQTENVKHEIADILGLDKADILLASAKLGTGTEDILESVVKRIPPPRGEVTNPLQALVFDSKFDTYKGVVVLVRIMNGVVQKGMKVMMMSNNIVYEVQEVGVFDPRQIQTDSLSCGEVGYITCSIRDAREVFVGDTVTDAESPAAAPLAGYKKVHPMVFSGIFPANSADFPVLKEAIEKLRLSDAAFVFEMEKSASLGMGFRCGFLGMLHMEIVEQRLEREYDLNLVITTPSVVYRILKKDGEIVEVDNPVKLPSMGEVEDTEEPYVRAYIIIPKGSIGTVLELSESRRGSYVSTEYLDDARARIIYDIPLSEVIIDFYDRIKSVTKGYGSLDYELLDYRPTTIVKLDILINGEIYDAFSSIVFKDRAYAKGKVVIEKLKETIPRHLFQIILQAAIGGQVIARETIKAVGKNVTAKCYGGDITRKRKLWEKQKAGKKKMKQFGKVEIPQEAFFAALKAQ